MSLSKIVKNIIIDIDKKKVINRIILNFDINRIINTVDKNNNPSAVLSPVIYIRISVAINRKHVTRRLYLFALKLNINTANKSGNNLDKNPPSICLSLKSNVILDSSGIYPNISAPKPLSELYLKN